MSQSDTQLPDGNVHSPENEVHELFLNKGLSLSTAESCTGGRIAAKITALAGSSAYFKGGIVAYSNEVKESLLNISRQTLDEFGAVSKETVVEMAKGAMKAMKTDCAVATSGVAGPGGGTPDKPVGTVWIAAAYKEKIFTTKQEGDNGRLPNMERAANNALSLLLEVVKQGNITITQ